MELASPVQQLSLLANPPVEQLLCCSQRTHHLPRLYLLYASASHLYQLFIALSTSPQNGMRYPLSNFVSYYRCSLQHYSFNVSISQDIEHSSYAKAALHSYSQEAMQSDWQCYCIRCMLNIFPT